MTPEKNATPGEGNMPSSGPIDPSSGPIDGARPGTRFFVSHERHGRGRARVMAGLAAPLKNRRDVLGECHGFGAVGREDGQRNQ